VHRALYRVKKSQKCMGGIRSATIRIYLCTISAWEVIPVLRPSEYFLLAWEKKPSVFIDQSIRQQKILICLMSMRSIMKKMPEEL
jgi:hypothetical protein